MKSIKVDLSRDPGDRWQLTDVDIADATGLIDCYAQDIGGVSMHREMLEMYDMSGHLAVEYRAEINEMAIAIDRPYLKVLLGNVYYDVLKLVMGSGTVGNGSSSTRDAYDLDAGGFACSAYAVDTADGPVHARNLDWSDYGNRILSTGSRKIEFTGGAAGPFTIIGWPGYLGALSAIAPERFSITLNSVLSEDPLRMAAPVSFVIRNVLETTSTYADAVERLSNTPLMCDCLMLVAGTKPGEMAVVERTPSRSAVREPHGGFIAVTNDYRKLGKRSGGFADLGTTACERYNRIEQLLTPRRDRAPYELLSMLSDPMIKMQTMTVQQMVMCPATGKFSAMST